MVDKTEQIVEVPASFWRDFWPEEAPSAYALEGDAILLKYSDRYTYENPKTETFAVVFDDGRKEHYSGVCVAREDVLNLFSPQ